MTESCGPTDVEQRRGDGVILSAENGCPVLRGQSLGRTILPFLTALALTLAGAITAFGPLRLAAAGAKEPDRIVAIGGAITEILYALGLETQIVGVDTTSLYPAEALKTKPSVGYFRAFSAEGVLSLKPSLVIAADAAGPADAIKLVQDAGVDFERLPDDFSPEGIEKKIEAIGRLAHAEDKAAQLARKVADDFRELAALRAGVNGQTRVLLVLAIPDGRPLVAGRGTAADAMIRLAGGVNVSAFQGYKQMIDEAIVAAAPDVIVLMGNGKQPSADEIFAMAAFAMTPAAKERRLVMMDGLALLGFGPRTPDAAKELLVAFYPKRPAAAEQKD
jgi:iron complex transport system substrate-binding protein